MSSSHRNWRTTVDGAGLAGVLVLTTVAYFGAYKPLESRVSRRHEVAEKTADVRAELTSVAARLDEARARCEKLRAEEAAAPRVLPQSALNQRMGALSECAERAGLKVQQMRPGESSEQGQFVSVALTLSGECTYVAFSGFLERLQQHMRDVTVESFELVAQRGAGRESRAIFNVRAAWYARKDDAVPAAATAEEKRAGG